ncbi:MAG TPA: M48 family metallopeptidase, partial [Casimicrobiaceae bacterium]|nr:M48 family metallopeptidase [Casimicrobiaceae bacterium]
MTPALFTAAFVAALALSLTLQLWLARRHVRHVAAHRDRVPAAFADRIELPAHQRAADYTVARTRFGVVETLFEAGVLLALTLGGGIAALVALTGAFDWGPLGQDLALVVALALVSGVLGLPFSWHRTFGIEARFGFNRTTPRL